MPKRVPYLLVDAFTRRPGAGNRAGVVLDAGGLSQAEMQAVAAILRVSETVFVTDRDPSPGGRDFWVRYFTPTQEIEFCGHATLALGFVMAGQAMVGSGGAELKTLVGGVPLEVEYENGEVVCVWMRQPEPEYRPLPPEARSVLAEALGLDPRAVHRGLPMAAAYTGLWTAFVPLIDAGLLDALDPDHSTISALSRAWGVSSVHPYAATSPTSFAGRDFAPLVGIPEDPVTGSANGALAALLARAGVLPRRGSADGQDEVEVALVQGHAMGSPGEVRVVVEYRGDRVDRVRVGGCAVSAYEGALKL